MKNKIIAVDFDGTLCENRYPEIGNANKELIKYLIDRQADGDKLILWTCRCDDMLIAAVEWCKEQGLTFNAVNDNLQSSIEWANGCNSRKIYADEYIDDKNVLVTSCREKSEMELWAEQEIKIACQSENPDRKEGEFDYGCACYESALRAYKSLLTDGHSGFSISMTKNILNRLIEGKPLTPIIDCNHVIVDEKMSLHDVYNEGMVCSGSFTAIETWNLVCNDIHNLIKTYQCRRMSSLFKYVYPDGHVKYKDINRFVGVNLDTDSTYHSGLIDRIMDEIYPITMPYMPEQKPWYVYTTDYLTDRANGDFDTVGIHKVISPSGETINIKRYFKETNHNWVEIGFKEFHKRIEMHEYRLRNEKGYKIEIVGKK